MPEEYSSYKAVQLWYSREKDEWHIDFWWTDDPEEIKPVNEKYQDTYKEISDWSSWVPKTFFRLFIEMALLEDPYYDKYKKLFTEYKISFIQPPSWGR